MVQDLNKSWVKLAQSFEGMFADLRESQETSGPPGELFKMEVGEGKTVNGLRQDAIIIPKGPDAPVATRILESILKATIPGLETERELLPTGDRKLTFSGSEKNPWEFETGLRTATEELQKPNIQKDLSLAVKIESLFEGTKVMPKVRVSSSGELKTGFVIDVAEDSPLLATLKDSDLKLQQQSKGDKAWRSSDGTKEYAGGMRIGVRSSQIGQLAGIVSRMEIENLVDFGDLKDVFTQTATSRGGWVDNKKETSAEREPVGAAKGSGESWRSQVESQNPRGGGRER